MLKKKEKYTKILLNIIDNQNEEDNFKLIIKYFRIAKIFRKSSNI